MTSGCFQQDDALLGRLLQTKSAVSYGGWHRRLHRRYLSRIIRVRPSSHSFRLPFHGSSIESRALSFPSARPSTSTKNSRTPFPTKKGPHQRERESVPPARKTLLALASTARKDLALGPRHSTIIPRRIARPPPPLVGTAESKKAKAP